MTTFIDHKMKEARADIIAEHPNMAQPWYAAALGNVMISRCTYWLTPPIRRNEFLSKCGFYGGELVAERAKRDAEEANYEQR